MIKVDTRDPIKGFRASDDTLAALRRVQADLRKKMPPGTPRSAVTISSAVRYAIALADAQITGTGTGKLNALSGEAIGEHTFVQKRGRKPFPQKGGRV